MPCALRRPSYFRLSRMPTQALLGPVAEMMSLRTSDPHRVMQKKTAPHAPINGEMLPVSFACRSGTTYEGTVDVTDRIYSPEAVRHCY